jgi:hypothetical protein
VPLRPHYKYRKENIITFQGDEELIAYLQAIIGYIQTGHTDRQEFYIFHGRQKSEVACRLDKVQQDPGVAFHPDVRLRNRWPRHARVYPSELDCFAACEDVPAPSTKQLEALRELPEATVKAAFGEIIGEPYLPKDWGGEKSDLYSSRLKFDGRPLSAAFLLKGSAVFKPMHPADLGKRGDQLVRLFEEPAELLVLQHCHCHKIMPTVIRQMEALAVQPTRPRLYCVIDGADTYRILKAHNHLSEQDAN